MPKLGTRNLNSFQETWAEKRAHSPGPDDRRVVSGSGEAQEAAQSKSPLCCTSIKRKSFSERQPQSREGSMKWDGVRAERWAS